jgi:hypothetical protein
MVIILASCTDTEALYPLKYNKGLEALRLSRNISIANLELIEMPILFFAIVSLSTNFAFAFTKKSNDFYDLSFTMIRQKVCV